MSFISTSTHIPAMAEKMGDFFFKKYVLTSCYQSFGIFLGVAKSRGKSGGI
jgi:hypothetical protein